MTRTPVPTAPGADAGADELQIGAVRAFNRFYTRVAGALDEGHLRTPFSLAEARVLYELAHRERPAAAAIGRDLGLDAGYLSRLLAGLARRGLLARTPSPIDGRQSTLELTPAGRAAFADLDAHAQAAVAALLAPLPAGGRARLVGAMGLITAELGGAGGAAAGVSFGAAPWFAAAPDAISLGGSPLGIIPLGATPLDVESSAAGAGAVGLREPGPGDLGWVVERHGALYAAEYGWDDAFEVLVARIVADFGAGRDPARERAWIAEHAGARAGCVFLIRHPERPGVARLRLLLVEPSARGLGVGGRLVDACTTFARAAGYHTITLWTNSVLAAARRRYERAGYRLVDEAPHHSFGRDLVGQHWELTL